MPTANRIKAVGSLNITDWEHHVRVRTYRRTVSRDVNKDCSQATKSRTRIVYTPLMIFVVVRCSVRTTNGENIIRSGQCQAYYRAGRRRFKMSSVTV